MRGIRATVAGCVLILSACSYYNAIYNADRLYLEAEAHRRAGRDSAIESTHFPDLSRLPTLVDHCLVTKRSSIGPEIVCPSRSVPS